VTAAITPPPSAAAGAKPHGATPAPEPSSPAAQQVGAGTSALLAGQTAEATRRFRAALGSEPANAHAWRGLGLALEQQQDFEQALAAYKRYLSLAPSGPQADAVRKRMRALAR
jgi:Flp pilus assembly protein TadD